MDASKFADKAAHSVLYAYRRTTSVEQFAGYSTATNSLGDIWKHTYLGPRKPRRIAILFFALYKYSYLLTYL